ncbi:MAG: D-alanine--D-alanine ligase [Bacteroidales bacterium]|jgi:D-alanine-D-alanine ligase|nr:D-alanine--D-alanine ligase [Bacteroidales bacterium]
MKAEQHLNKPNIAVLGGGYTSERQISLNSAKQVFDSIDNKRFNAYLIDVTTEGMFFLTDNDRISVDLNSFSINIDNNIIIFDFAYIVLHGSPGEDGKIQGYFDIMNIPYSSCGVFTSSLTFNKVACKKILADSGITMAKSTVIHKEECFSVDEIISMVGLPCFVKPNTSGSSYGITKVYEKEEFIDAVNKAAEEDSTIIVEEFIKGTEVSCGILKTSKNIHIFPVTEIYTKNDYFDTEAKYTPGFTEEITPARITKEETKLVQENTSIIYDELECKGIVRVDYIIKNGVPYFLEINSIPGMSAESIIPKQIRSAGKTIAEILSEVIDDGLLNPTK